MVFPMVLLKLAAHWVITCYSTAWKFRSHGFHHRSSSRPPPSPSSSSYHYPHVSKWPLNGRESQTSAFSFEGTLLQPSSSPFPFFMLVAFEAGSPIRSLLLLAISWPFHLLLGGYHDLTIRIMAFVAFFGLRTTDVDVVARAVLPKFFLEGVNLAAYEAIHGSKGRRVAVSRLPRVIVEVFLKEHVGVEEVAAPEMQVVFEGRYFTGMGLGDRCSVGGNLDVGLVGSCNPLHHKLFITHCKEVYVVNKEGCISPTMPREKYPKPLIFHDGRLAFLPTPLASLALLLWLPFATPLAVFRILIGLLPFKATVIIGSFTGIRLRVQGLPLDSSEEQSSTRKKAKGVLFVCNHRTLLDPVMLSTALGRPVTAVTYSLSRMSEMISPIRTVRLTRDRLEDGRRMQRLLSEGDLVVCPEGTTCREPYLLRFSSLFAELADEMVPVAVNTISGVFYGTTATGLKWLDPVFFMMNPRPEYRMRFLGRVPAEMTCAGGLLGSEVANRIQRQIADALGFECTGFTRRDKYLMLARNEGVVRRTEFAE